MQTVIVGAAAGLAAYRPEEPTGRGGDNTPRPDFAAVGTGVCVAPRRVECRVGTLQPDRKTTIAGSRDEPSLGESHTVMPLV